MNSIVILAALSAASLSFEYENFSVDGRIVTILLRVTNNSSSSVTRGSIKCAFQLDDKRVVDTGTATVRGLAPGQTKYEKARIVTDHDVRHAECYIDSLF